MTTDKVRSAQDELRVQEGRVIAVALSPEIERALNFPAIRSARNVLELSNFADVAETNLFDSDIVVSPVVANDFDVIELAEELDAWGFGGHYLAVTLDLPQPKMIRAEVAASVNQLNFDVQRLTQQKGPTSV